MGRAAHPGTVMPSTTTRKYSEIKSRLRNFKAVRHVLSEIGDEFSKLGAEVMSYHFVAPFHRQNSSDALIIQEGFSPQWVELYRTEEFRKSDAITEYAMHKGRMMPWRKIIDDRTLTENEKRFVEISQNFNLIDGISIPLFGPNGRDAYCAVSLGREIVAEDELLALRFQELAIAGHERIAELINDLEQKKANLSSRETQVLYWMCHSKSNQDIATIMGLAPSTIDTYVRRIFVKLNSCNRIGACLRGLSLGLVQI